MQKGDGADCYLFSGPKRCEFRPTRFSRPVFPSGRLSIVARILAIKAAGGACPKNGSCSHTAVGPQQRSRSPSVGR
jgi:hypothetical protein